MEKLHRSESRQTWDCETCSFSNSILLSNCEMCDTNKPAKYIKKQNQSVNGKTSHTLFKTQKLVCLDGSCKTENQITQIQCKKCGKFLLKQLEEDDSDDGDEIKQKKQAEKISLAVCHKCKFQNDPNNVTCVNCEVRMKKKRQPKKPKVRAVRRGPNYCQVCNSYKRYIVVGEWQCNCPDADDGILIQKLICNYCFQNLALGKYDQHVQSCKQRQIFYDRKRNKSLERCTDLQVDTMIYMHKKCEKLHFGKQKRFQNRIQKLGYNKKDLQNLYHYIVNYAPIIIHMHADQHFQFFVKDTHYRSQFETSKSSGSLSRTARTGWEDRMFDNMHHNAKDSQRVKYGTMNFTNDPQGVAVCLGYGKSYFMLKEHVRDRCTMTDMDSSSPAATICTFRFCFHLLAKLSDVQIKAAFDGSKAQQVKSAGVIGAYKEIQIHGPVQFSKDIERVYINKAQTIANPDCLKQIEEFCKKNNLDYEIFGEAPPVHPVGMFGGHGMLGAPPVGFGGAGGIFSAPLPFGGFSMASSSSSVFFHRPPMKTVPIKYTAVSFPYSSKAPQQDDFDQQDYI